MLECHGFSSRTFMRAVLAVCFLASALGLPASSALARRGDAVRPVGAEASGAAIAGEMGTHNGDAELLRNLEERLERQREDNQATQQALAALQARLREAEHTRRDDPAIYGLSTLVVLLLGTIAALLWRLAKLQKQRTWAREAHELSEFVSRPLKTSPLTSPSAPFSDATVSGVKSLATAPREPGSTTVPAAAPRVRRELTAEEVIDLEQQADFFIALGQEESAIDLLMGHVRSSGGTSPMPYLKLLEIYRRRSDGDAYERIRERFNRRFNGQAPAWEVDSREGRALESYAAVVTRLQAAWQAPAQVVDLLSSLLFRRDSSEQPFELPAYEELLFLYAIARDVLEHAVNPDGVDLLLPLGGEEEPSAIVHAEVSRAPDAWLEAPAVDLELDLDARARSTR